MGVKIIVAACGTVSSYLDEIGNPQDVIGVIKPTCLAAVNATRNGKIGVMATTAAVNSKSYEYCIMNLNSSTKIYQQARTRLLFFITYLYSNLHLNLLKHAIFL